MRTLIFLLAGASDFRNFAFLNGPEQSRLHVNADIGDLVKEESAFIGKLDFPDGIFDCAGKSAFHMSEQFALEKTLDERTAIDRHEWFLGAMAQPVDRPGHDLFAHARFAGNEHRGIHRATAFCTSRTTRLIASERPIKT